MTTREENSVLLIHNFIYIIRLRCPLGLAEIKDQPSRKYNIYSESITELTYPKPRQNIKVIRSHDISDDSKALYTLVFYMVIIYDVQAGQTNKT